MLLSPDLRSSLRNLLDELDELIEARPDDAALARLRPPAYVDDPERDAAYQLLAGEELRTSRRAAIARVGETLYSDTITVEDAWAWMQAINALRLVVGTTLDVREDVDPPHPDEVTPGEGRLWAAYELLTYLQHEVVDALS